MSLTLTDLLLEDGGFDDHKFYDLQPPPPDDPALEQWLEQTFSQEQSYGGGETDQGGVLGNGEQWFTCTSWARMVAAAMPDRSRVHGFFIDDNPEATEIAKYCDGHDFAVVDGRYIVDGWAKNVEGISKKVVFDMQNQRDRKLIMGLYGNPSNWTQM